MLNVRSSLLAVILAGREPTEGSRQRAAASANPQGSLASPPTRGEHERAQCGAAGLSGIVTVPVGYKRAVVGKGSDATPPSTIVSNACCSYAVTTIISGELRILSAVSGLAARETFLL